MKKLLVVATFGIVAVAAAQTVAAPATPTAPEGNPAVYTRIAALTDCDQLQGEFNVADATGRRARQRGDLATGRATTGYMKAADNRLKAIGCY
jgi:hypothetical protein